MLYRFSPEAKYHLRMLSTHFVNDLRCSCLSVVAEIEYQEKMSGLPYPPPSCPPHQVAENALDEQHGNQRNNIGEGPSAREYGLGQRLKV